MRTLLRRFLNDQTGSIIAETVIVLPFMLWAYLALFVYWDAFRAVNISQKAAYTISDMLSREMVTLPTTYVDGMDSLMTYLVGSENASGVRIRVTSVTYNLSKKQYQVEWSRSPNNALPQLTTATIANLKSQIPTLADGDHVMLVETEVDYEPPFDIGMGDFSINVGDRVLKQFIVTRPRFVPKICLTGVTCT